MSELRIELFTTSQLTDPAEGRALLRALEEHVPSWTPRRYGWGEPLRHVYDPGKAEHFWGRPSGLDVMFRNATKTATGEVHRRISPWAILSRVKMAGTVAQAELDGGGIGAFLAECGRSLDLAWAMAHIFSERQAGEYRGAWFDVPGREENRVKAAIQGPFPYFLRDVYWGNVFGPPYTELFGADKLRTAPAAAVTELRPGYFYLQLTESILDLCDKGSLPRNREVRDAVREHLGADCFYQRGKDPVSYRAPHFRAAAEEGLWKPGEGVNMTDELRALLAKAPGQ
ncbi:MAG: hypothetical protein J2P25_18495 [Nocardiopsaceae bacterium]|nr:hypothetical protein [Nocardiopsaceae bacterium]